ncbi:MAG: glycosyltransferase family 1 protein [Planctomycetota bacterium]|nr:glycosyltransferase family 1 protein [Planctomycetota bacterium]
MRIAVYLQDLDRTRQPTGLGKHAINMTRCLARTPGVELQIVTPRENLVDGRLPEGSYYAGIPTVGIPLPRKYLHRLWVLSGHPRVDRWCRANGNDADWVYSPLELYVPARRPALAVTVHDMQPFEMDLSWSNSMEHRSVNARWRTKFPAILKHSRLLLAVSDFTKSRLVELVGADPARIAVVGNGVEEEFFAMAERPRGEYLQREGPYVLVIGGLSVRKSGPEVLAVARALARQGSPVRIVVAGKGQAKLEEEAASLPNVVRRGYVAEEEMPALVRGAEAVMVLSRYEGFGIPAAEAMAAGTPAVVSGHASLRGVVGDAGIVVDVDKPDAVAEVVTGLWKDAALRERFAAAGRARAAMYHWEACAARLVEALNARN